MTDNSAMGESVTNPDITFKHSDFLNLTNRTFVYDGYPNTHLPKLN